MIKAEIREILWQDFLIEYMTARPAFLWLSWFFYIMGNPLKTAYHGPVFIQHAQTLQVQRTYRPSRLIRRIMQPVLQHYFIGPEKYACFCFLSQRGKSMSQEYMLSGRIVVEPLLATVAVAPFAVEGIIMRSFCVGLVHAGVESADSFKKRGKQRAVHHGKHRGHAYALSQDLPEIFSHVASSISLTYSASPNLLLQSMQRKLIERQPNNNFTGPPQSLHFKSVSFIRKNIVSDLHFF